MDGSARPDLLARFDAELAPRERAVLSAARAWADAHGVALYLVGGSVRDLLLGRRRLDLDLAVEGNAAALGRELAGSFAARITLHEQFGTASLEGDGWTLDLVRTRAERYTAPAALPEVAPGSIADDLARRDFTVQAMALRLDTRGPGVLLDPFGGEQDLARRVYRVLHRDSFRDDPTRILRLARYIARLGFLAEAETLRLAWRDGAYLDLLTPARIAHELERGFAEPLPERMLSALDDLHALLRVFGEAVPVASLAERFGRLRDDGGPAPGLPEFLCTLAAEWPRVALERLDDRVELRQDAIVALHDLPAARRTLREQTEARAVPSLVVEALGRCALAAVRGAAAAAGGSNARLVRRYLREWRDLRPRLRGDDLIALGVERGPRVGELLRALTAARLDGLLLSTSAEQAFVRCRLAEATNPNSEQANSRRAMAEDACSVCSEPLSDQRATCNQCGADFHFALRVDVPARDCGDAWIDDEIQALVFACNRCLGRELPASAPRRYARRAQGDARAVARARRPRTPGDRGGRHAS